MKKKHTILFCYVSIAIFLSLFVLVGCPPPPNNNNTIATPTSAKQRLRLDTTNKTLILSFKKNIKSIKTPKNISVYKKSTNTPTSPENKLAQDTHTARTVNGKLVITLKNTFTAGESFYVQMQKDTIMYKDDTTNAHPITSPKVTVPAIFVTKVEIDKTNNAFTLSFNTDLSDKNDSKITVSKNNTSLTPSTDYTIAIDSTDKTKINITLTAPKLHEGDTYNVQFKPDAVQGTNGIGNDAITTNKVSVLLPPVLASNDLVLKGNTLTVTFKKAIKITDKNKITVSKNNTSLTPSTDYTIAIDSTDKTKINITLKAEKLHEGDTYNVQFKPNAVQGTNGIGNDAITTNKVSVLLPPALASNNLALKGNTLTVTFKNAIKITDKNKINIYKSNKNLLTPSTDYTVAIDGTDKTKINITLKAEKLHEGDTYNVQFKPNAVQGTNGIGNDAITTNEVSVLLPALASNNLALKGNTLIVTFKSAIKITDKTKINVYKSNKNLLTLSKDYTVAIDGTDKTKINITLKAEKLHEGDTYKIQFKPNAVQGTNGISNDAITTNKVSVLLPPVLASNDLVLKGNTLTVTFKKAIKITDKTKITVYNNKKSLTLPKDYTVTIDNNKVKIILTAAPSLKQKYQVKFLASAVQDIANNQPNKVMETNEYDTIRIWKRVTASAEWTNRSDHTSVVFKNKIWVLGGNDDSNKNDVWSSNNGKTWHQETANAGWTARCLHTSVVFNEKIWVLGGWDGSNKNDVWSSSNGKTWHQETASAGWTARYGHTAVVFNEKIWVLGGWDGSRKNDVWSSSDGKTWTKVTDATGWTVRSYHTSVVFDEKIWMLGGRDSILKNDVWSSSDGKKWTKGTDAAAWTGRSYHASVVFDEKIWVLGGWDGINKNDVWNSSNGKDWTEVTNAAAGWTTRYGHTSVVFDEKILVLGGSNGMRKNDVWTYGLP